MFPKFWNNYTDKVLHFAIGAIAYLVVYGIAKLIWLGLVAVLIVAVVKEAYDAAKSLEYQRFDVADIAATFAGGIVAAIAFYALQRVN